jgi:hypothetical protein
MFKELTFSLFTSRALLSTITSSYSFMLSGRLILKVNVVDEGFGNTVT